jgi:hypothetical protein
MNSPGRACGITRRVALRLTFGALLLPLSVARLAAQHGEIERRPMESSVLATAGYDARKRVLEIEFHSGAIYRYLGVPGEIYRRLLSAESKGHFFGANIRNKFRCERVRARTEK